MYWATRERLDRDLRLADGEERYLELTVPAEAGVVQLMGSGSHMWVLYLRLQIGREAGKRLRDPLIYIL
jgi:hypothetical protein